MSETSFQDGAFLLLDRLERTVEELKDQLRGADEFLLIAHARVNDLMKKNGPGLPHVLLDNAMPQSIGVRAGWDDGQFVIQVVHRGEEAEMLPPGGQMKVEVSA